IGEPAGDQQARRGRNARDVHCTDEVRYRTRSQCKAVAKPKADPKGCREERTVTRAGHNELPFSSDRPKFPDAPLEGSTTVFLPEQKRCRNCGRWAQSHQAFSPLTLVPGR